MPTTNLWLTIGTDRHDIEVVINDIPALRLGASAGLRAPVNEYVVAGLNALVVRLSSWADPEDGLQAVDVTVELEAMTFEAGTRVASVQVARHEVKDAPVQPGPLLSFMFPYERGGLPELGDFRQLVPDDAPTIIAAIEASAAAWRAGEAERLADILAPYFASYGRAYPGEGDEMRTRFLRMARAFTGGPHQVQHNPAQIRLAPCAGGRLMDATGRDGAAIRLLRPGAPPYDFWALWGIQGGRAVIAL